MTLTAPDLQLSLSHAGPIQDIRQRYHHETSSHAFHTLYIWRRFVGNELHLQPEMFTLRYRAKGENTWLFPCGSRICAGQFIAEHMGERDFSLCYLRAEDAEWLEQAFPHRFGIMPSPGDSEYIVSREKHLALSGKKYEKLRGKMKHAEREHRIETELLCPENIGKALEIIREWHGNRQAGGSLRMYGDEEDSQPLLNMEELGISGVLMYADGEPYGVAAGFMLSDDTFDLFLAKEKGRDPALGYALRREMIRALPEPVRWINLEDDLQIEGLRTMKKQMIPEKMNDMWTAVLKDET